MNRTLGVLNILGLILVIFGLTMLVPRGISWWIADGAAHVYDMALAITVASGAALWLATHARKAELQVRDGFLLVVLVWTVLPAFAMLPLLFWIDGLSVTDGYFEAMSGLTATGGTVLTGLERLPGSINVWRAQMVWIGGMGLIVLAVAVLPLLGVGGRQLFKAETPGPMKESRLTPRLAETAKGLWLVYAGISVACVVAYRLGGMSWLDALRHGFTTMGLGGFSSYDASFAAFDSVTIEVIAICFMLAAGLNFASHFVAFRERSPAQYRRDPEAGLFVGVTLASGLGIALYLWALSVYPDFWTALRYAMFNTVSIATTTGYSNTDYALWPVFAPLWIIFLSSFVTCSGSTGGGIKMIRARLLYQQVYREFVKILHPHAVAQSRIGASVVPNQIVFAVLAFLFVYIASLVSLTLLLAASGLDMITAFGAAVGCLNNLGPGLGQVGPASTYQGLTDFQTWVCSFAMLLGRLELFTLLIVLTPAFWRK